MSWWNVTNKNGNLSICFHFGKFILEPLKMTTGIFSAAKEVEICIVKSLRVDCDNFHIIVKCAVACREACRVESFISNFV